MTKLSISLAAAMLSVTFAPTAGAYSFEPASQPLDTLTQTVASSSRTALADGVCTVRITPILAEILALPDGWRSNAEVAQTALACAAE